MGRTRRRVLPALALAMLVMAAVFAVAAQAAGNPKATGGGTTLEGGEESTFTFNAVEKPDGSVTGHLVYHFRAADNTIFMDIDCLNISGNTAKLSGVVTKILGDPPAFIFVGQGAVFTVTDNGQGSQAPPDLISDVILFGAASCDAAFTPVPYLPMDGNIQVSP